MAMPTPGEALAALGRGDAGAVALLVAFTLLVAVLLAQLVMQRIRRDAVLLLGPCGAGKTALFFRVRVCPQSPTGVMPRGALLLL
jgi:ABC-type lipopolysaccharide export system ATPase subunit